MKLVKLWMVAYKLLPKIIAMSNFVVFKPLLLDYLVILRSLGFPVLNKSFKELIDPTFTADGLTSDTKAAVILGLIFKEKAEMLKRCLGYPTLHQRIDRPMSNLQSLMKNETQRAEVKFTL